MAEMPDIPGYKIEKILGKGGMGTVYLGFQEELNRNVAIKVLEPSLLTNKEAVNRFYREAKSLAGMSHSNIIQIFAYGKIDEFPYFIMEYLKASLKDLIRKHPKGRLNPSLSLSIVEKIMMALEYAQSKGIYHRDIKPENIMFREDKTPVLMDFGIAGLYEATTQLTEIGKPMGTVYYMSPEQCKAEKDLDIRSDLYSLGIVLFEMLTGKRPYDGEDSILIALQHIEAPIPELPLKLSSYQPLIDKMMAKEKEIRLSGWPEFLEILDKIMPNTIYPDSSPTQFPIQPTQEHEPIISEFIKSQTTHPPMRNKFTFRTTPRKEFTESLKSVLEDLLSKMFSYIEKILKPWVTNLISKVKNIFQKKISPFFHSIREYLFKKKVLIGAIIAALVALLLIFFLFIHPPAKKVSFINILIDQASNYYKEKLSLARDLSVKDNELESLKKGLEVTNALIKINPSSELIGLEKKFSEGIKRLEEEFNKHFEAAKSYFAEKNFAKARESISKAKKIKITQGLELFEKSIDMYEKNPDPVEPLKQAHPRKGR